MAEGTGRCELVLPVGQHNLAFYTTCMTPVGHYFFIYIAKYALYSQVYEKRRTCDSDDRGRFLELRRVSSLKMNSVGMLPNDDVIMIYNGE